MLQGFTGGYKVFTKGYKRLQELTVGYKRSQGVSRE